jgi:hypothetical protein
LLQESLNKTLNHGNEVTIDLFDCDSILILVADFLAQVSDDHEVARLDKARSDLLHTEDENPEKRVLHSSVICFVQALLPNSEELFLHGFLHLLEGQLSEFTVLLAQTKPEIGLFFVRRVKYRQL